MVESMTAQGSAQDIFAAFWVMKYGGNRAQNDAGSAAGELRDVFCSQQSTIHFRGAYSLAGIHADADAIFWLFGPDLEALQHTWLALRQTGVGRELQSVDTYIGLATPSQYVADHVPAFLREVPPRRYLSIYPFVKTHEWYLLPYEERQRLMRQHGELGREYPGILTNTISSFGLGDQEFVVAIEGDDPGEIMRMMRHLRAAEVRTYTAYDTPIYLGRRLDLDELAAQFAI